uniref:(northern house mosquito) hypothetical protein n=1 Tax=Culex pipiens TaxID=7175 RepID=A0A8D8GH51_CULPI
MRRGTSSAATSERARVVRLKVAKVAPRITGVTMSPLVPVWRALPRASLRAAPTLSNVANRWRGWRKSESPTRTRRITWLCRSVYVRERTAAVCSSNRYNKNTNSNLSPGCTRRQTSRTSSNLQKWVHR